MLSLVKVGNLKIGKVSRGKPIAIETILVTEPTKDNKENFKILPGFSQEGEKSVKVSLPFDDPNLNFEVNYTNFATINDIEYILKAEDINKPILAYPLDPEYFDKPILDLGNLTEKRIETYNMSKTGFLKVHVEGYSSYGEVFYFKTKSLNSIRSLSDQLRILNKITKGQSACIPLELKAIKKDSNDKQIIYVSIGYKGNILTDLNEILKQREELLVDIKGMEELYKKEREPSNIEKIKKEDKIEINRTVEQEIQEIKDENKAKTPDEIFIENYLKANNITKINVNVALALYKKLKKEEFFNFLTTELSLADALKKLKNNPS